MNHTITVSEVKARAIKLRDILTKHGHQLKHAESLEVISKLEGAADWNTYSAHLTALQITLERNPGNRNSEMSSSAKHPQKPLDETELLFCSFCDRTQHEVHKLIAGPNIQICEYCTDLCINIILEETFEASEDRGEIENMPILSSFIREGKNNS